MEFKSLPPRAQACMRLQSVIGWLIPVLALAGGRIAVGYWRWPLPVWADWVLLGLAVLLVVYILIAPRVRYRHYRYYIDAEQVVVEEGLLTVRRAMAPIERVHQVSTRRGPIERKYGLSRVSAITAGGEVTMGWLEAAEADAIAELLKNRIRGIILSQREESGAAQGETAETEAMDHA